MIKFSVARIQRTHESGSPQNNVAVLASCVGAVFLAFALVTGLGLSPTSQYMIWLGLFTFLTSVFLVCRSRQGHLNIFEYPVFLTILAFVQLGLAPILFFVYPTEVEAFVTEDGLVRALFLCVFGMAAFWAGSIMLHGRQASKPLKGVTGGDESHDPIPVAIGLFVVGSAAKAYLLLNHMYSFVASQEAVANNRASVQVLASLGQFATLALIVVAIERCSSGKPMWTALVFWPMLTIQCGWGLISGMKSELISNFVIVAAVATLGRQKLALKWALAPVIALVLLYPAYNSYRLLVRSDGHSVTDLSSAAEVGTRALQTNSAATDYQGWVASGLQSSVQRLSGLTSVAQVLALGPYKEVLKGDEKMWMLPIYPFVPRFLWKNKPILDKGARFSVLLGGTEDTSIAVTYPADCFLLGGWLGVLGGMFAWGMLAEGVVQFLFSDFSKKRLFIYISLTATAVSSPIENTVFAFWSGLIKQSVAVALIAFLIYGYRAKSRVASHR